jgi:putative membrane protein insertion efficiency factor
MGRSKSGRTRLIFVAIVVGWIAHDLLVPPRYALDARAAVAAINEYRAHVSPHLRGVVQCRFEPTCSWYGHESIRKHGLLVGGAKTFWRIARCGPWTKLGTVDLP